MTAPTLRLPDDEVRSLAEILAEQPEEIHLEVIESLSEDAQRALLYDWSFWGRPKQQEPEGEYFCWLLLAGRGFGKTKTGAQWVRKKVEAARDVGVPVRIALIAETAADARDVLVMGDSGIMASAHPDFYPKYEPSKRRVTWPDGSMAFTFSGDEPGQLRGPQFHYAWVDEVAKYQYPTDTLDNLEFGLRLGETPQMCVTTTPRPIPVIKQLVKDEHTIITTGSTYENVANLAPSYIKRVVHKYEGTRLGRQELHAHILDDVPGAMWTRDMLERLRVNRAPELTRIVIGVDPAATDNPDSDETGIMCVGKGVDGHAYVFHDLSGQFSPGEWAARIALNYHRFQADRVVAEVNNGGDMVEATLRTADRRLSFKQVRASKAKHIRAEPIAALYEQGKVHHVGLFAKLEDQMVAFTKDGYIGGGSPDRADAMVWALTDLMLGGGGRWNPDNFATVKR